MIKGNRELVLSIALVLSTGGAPLAQAQSADFQDAEYYCSGGLDLINAADAYAAGYTGKGVTLGICDLPINFSNPEYNGKTNSFMASALDIDDGGPGVYDWSRNEIRHGTHVAGIAAASRNGSGMQGVAYDAEIIGTVTYNNIYIKQSGREVESSVIYVPYFSHPDVKIINNSWGDENYLDLVIAGGMTPADYEEYKVKLLSNNAYQQRLQAVSRDKLLVLASSNTGQIDSAEGSALGLFFAGAQNNILNVTSLDTGNSRSNGIILAKGNLMADSSALAKYVEDSTIAARGDAVVSANSAFASTGNIDISMGGTSMAAPFVTGGGALVQQAFPYMSAKQIGDVLLSTANDNVDISGGLVANMQSPKGNAAIDALNIFVVDPSLDGMSEKDIAQRYMDLYNTNQAGEIGAYYRAGMLHVYYAAPLQELIGQGVLDVGAAVRGPGALNARRLTSSDISSGYTVGGTTEKQALYTIDTQGYDSTWSNDIKEIKAGYIAADSTEADLLARYKYYDTNWLSYTGKDAAYRAGAAVTTRTLMDVYNQQVRDSGLAGLHVGLYKAGAGKLSLTGTNTYQGSSIAADGALSIDGSVAGDAWSVQDTAAGTTGTISGSGTIRGNLCNHGIAQPSQAGNLTVNGILDSDGVLGLVTAADGQTARRIIVGGAASIKGSTLQRSPGSAYLPDKSYTFLTASGGITGSLTNTAGSAFSGLLSIKNLATTGSSGTVTLGMANNTGSLNENQQWTYDSLANLQANTQGDSRKQAQLGLLLGASSEAASAGLSSAAQSGTADGAAMTMSSLTAMKAIGARTMYLSSAAGMAGGTSPARSGENVTQESSLIPVDLGPTTSGWLKFSKSWERLGDDGTNGHGFATSFGFDRSAGHGWRLGGFFSYGDNSFASTGSSLKNKDYRLGLYGIREQGPRQTFLYFDLGQQNNDMKRYITAGGSYQADSSYKSHTIELGGRYAYDLDYGRNKGWHCKPYGEAQIVRYNQDSYSESGAGIWNQGADSASSTYGAATVGLGLEKKTKNDEMEVHLGYKRVFSGNDPTYPVHWLDGTDSGHIARGSGLDRNLLVLGLHAEQNQESGWRLSGDVELEKGHSQRNIQASVMLKKSW